MFDKGNSDESRARKAKSLKSHIYAIMVYAIMAVWLPKTFYK
jgi:hypothetical protein